jgi:S1-C subfamily serine protease
MIFFILSCLFGYKDVDKIGKSSVTIQTEDSLGSGNIINYKGDSYIVTANHNLAELFITYDSEYKFIEYDLHYINKDKDIAVLKTKEYIKGIKYKKPKNIKVGDEVHYWCRPLGLEKKYINGIVSDITDDVIVLQAYAWMGCSGGLVFNMKNEALGVVVSIPYTIEDNQFHSNLVLVSRIKKEIFGE